MRERCEAVCRRKMDAQLPSNPSSVSYTQPSLPSTPFSSSTLLLSTNFPLPSPPCIHTHLSSLIPLSTSTPSHSPPCPHPPLLTLTSLPSPTSLLTPVLFFSCLLHLPSLIFPLLTDPLPLSPPIPYPPYLALHIFAWRSPKVRSSFATSQLVKQHLKASLPVKHGPLSLCLLPFWLLQRLPPSCLCGVPPPSVDDALVDWSLGHKQPSPSAPASHCSASCDLL